MAASCKASTRVYILVYLLTYGREDYITRYRDGAGEWIVQFSALDVSRRLNCGLTTFHDLLEKANILGVLVPVRVEGHSCLMRLLPIPAHRPPESATLAWATRYSSRRGKADIRAAEAAGLRPTSRGRNHADRKRPRSKSLVPPPSPPAHAPPIDSGAHSAIPGANPEVTDE